MKKNTSQGFSLIELAVVLFIVSLLLGGLLVPLSSQLEGRQRADAQAQLDEIMEALIGFAIINGRLPCYTTQTDPSNANYGLEDSPCNPTALTADASRERVDGILPWKTLGLDSGRDPWGIQRRTNGDLWEGYWRYRVDNNFHTGTFTLATDPATGSGISVRELNIATSVAGAPVYTTLTSVSEPPVAIVYSTGANLTEDGENSDYEQLLGDNPLYEAGGVSNLDLDGDGTVEDAEDFDDIVVWLTRPLLFNRMVKAGRLP